MKKKYEILFIVLIFPILSIAQSRNDAGLQGDAGALSGFYDANVPVNFPTNASSWWHLLDIRHSNTDNNFAMQFSGSFFNQELFFRKTNDSPATAWSKVLLETNGKVGIGTLTASQALTVKGNMNLENSTGGKYIGFGIPEVDEYNTVGSLYSSAVLALSHGLKPHESLGTLVYNHPTSARSAITIGGYGETGIKFYTKDVSTETPGTIFNETPRMTILNSGNIGIGTIDPKEYRLAVNGKIRAQEIKVEASPWPDYVFAKDYTLPTLQETEKHIKEKGHLAGIPSAAEVKANGIDLGEMNAKLLQKIEELTLHLIEMKKEIENLKNKTGSNKND